jgi:[ribosomal protein S5]-alanine N-acetyltransferase
MKLVPISDRPEENKEFSDYPSTKGIYEMTIEFYKKVGFVPPWIGYFASEEDGKIIGYAGFKGPPKKGAVEIAYGIEEAYRNQGKGTGICKLMVELALNADPKIVVTARTFSENNFSTKILQKNGFTYTGIVTDPEDGEVWEWVYQPDLGIIL